ncbi:MAG: LysE family transporter [Chloroflexi bacterium]|nr:LysE family transporter [Chloroflexota bacterium]
MLFSYLIQGIGFGLAAAAQPGPFQTYLVSQTLLKGWQRTLPAAFGPLISDGPIILLCLFVLSQVPVWMQRFLYLAGGLFILYLAFGAYKAWRDFSPSVPEPDSGTPQSVLKSALMNVLNPNPYIYWTLVTGPILLRGWRETPFNGIGFLAGFYIVLVLSFMAIILAFGTAQRFGPRVNRMLLGVSTVALFCFGVYQLWLGAVG